MANDPFSVVENYLQALYRWGSAGARVRDLACDLGRSPASVRAMLGKLEALGWVKHLPYRSATLTEAGLKEGARLERRHNLLERHLIEMLGYPPQDAHQEAERMALALSDALVARLEVLLERDESPPVPSLTSTLHRFNTRQGTR